MSTSSCYEIALLWWTWMICGWRNATPWTYRRLPLPRTEWSHSGWCKTHLNGGKCFKNMWVFYDLQLSDFRLTNSTAWVSTSKSWHWNLWEQDLWSSCGDHFGCVWITFFLICVIVIRFNVFLFWIDALFWIRLLSLCRREYGKLRKV